MGTLFEILFPSDKRAKIEVTHRAFDEIQRLENLMTVFRESRVTQINREAFQQPVVVEEELSDLIQLSLEVSRETEGAFDIAAGTLWSCWRFHRRRGSIPSADTLTDCLSKVGSSNLDLNIEERAVSLKKRGVTLNLGSIGKGFALDRAVHMLQNAGFGQALLHAGHSSFFAMGDALIPGTGWNVSIRHPVNRDGDLMRLSLRDQGMGTSGIAEQYFEVNGHRYGHILDPRTGQPPGHNLTAVAVAPTAALADALATAFFVMTLKAVEAFCEENREIGAIVVPASAKGRPLDVHTFGLASSMVDR
jgi:thiamine biosynthesis lipoprotein